MDYVPTTTTQREALKKAHLQRAQSFHALLRKLSFRTFPPLVSPKDARNLTTACR